MRRKGEMTAGMIRRAFPHRLLFPEELHRDLLAGGQFYRSCAPRALTETIEGARYIAIHFSDPADAARFQRHAGGELREGKDHG